MNTKLVDEKNDWILICKIEQEERYKDFKLEHEKLLTQYIILSNQRKEIEASNYKILSLLTLLCKMLRKNITQ